MERQKRWLPSRGPISLEKWGKEHSGLCPETPPGKRVSFPRTLFLQAGVEAAIFFYRPTWPAASKTNASWPAHQLGRAGEVIHRREEKTGTRTVTFCLLPKGTHPRPQPAQPVGGPLRAFQCEGRRPGNQREVQLPPTQPHQRRESRGKNLFPLGFFPPFLPKKWGPGWASHRSRPFQRRGTISTTFPRLYTWQTYCVTAKKIYALSNFFYPFSPFIIFHKEKEMERFR